MNYLFRILIVQFQSEVGYLAHYRFVNLIFSLNDLEGCIMLDFTLC